MHSNFSISNFEKICSENIFAELTKKSNPKKKNIEIYQMTSISIHTTVVDIIYRIRHRRIQNFVTCHKKTLKLTESDISDHHS